MTEPEYQQAKAIEQEYFNRRDRLDRFVAAALTGFECRLNANQFVPKEIARMVCSHAQAVLDELERQEKGQP